VLYLTNLTGAKKYDYTRANSLVWLDWGKILNSLGKTTHYFYNA